VTVVSGTPPGTGAARTRGRVPGATLDFLEDCEVSPNRKRTAPEVPEPRKRVKVLAPYSVSHDGTAYHPGQTAAVPESIAVRWLANRWVVDDTNK
jgi:hypothetical protein